MVCFAALETSQSTSSSSSSVLLEFSDADGVNIPLLQDGFDKRYDLPSGTLGLGWTDSSPPFSGEEEPERSAPVVGSIVFSSQGARIAPVSHAIFSAWNKLSP